MTTIDMQLLRDRIHGELVLPEDLSYDDTRRIWNAMVDRHPRMIIRCASVDDVVTAVRTGQELGLDWDPLRWTQHCRVGGSARRPDDRLDSHGFRSGGPG